MKSLNGNKLSIILVFSIFVLSCNELNLCTSTVGPWLSGYQVDEVIYTPDGLPVDTSNQEVDLELIDEKANEVEDCLSQYGDELPAHIKNQSFCWNGPMRLLWRDCVQIKIADDWQWSCDGKYMLLKDEAPIEGCLEKGFEEDPNCPCRWRAGIQKPNIVVVPPDLALFKDALTRYITNCYNVWISELKECASNN